MEFTKIWEQAKAFWVAQSMGRRIVLVAVALIALASSAALSFYQPTINYQTVASDLSEEDAAAVVERLESDKVPYRVDNRGGVVRVQVPVEKADTVRLSLAKSGVTAGGFGFKDYISGPYTVSASRESKLYHIALGREIGRIIAGMEAVRRAEVLLNVPKKSLYRASELKPSASVVVHLGMGRTLSSSEIRGIVSLVAGSVDGLTSSGVNLVDHASQPLWSGGDEARLSTSQREKERDVREKISKLLTKVVGPGEFHVDVTATYERSERLEENETYKTTKDSVVSESTSEETRGSQVIARGLAGARGNAPQAAGAAPAPTPDLTTQQTRPTRRSETKNLQPSRTYTRVSDTTPRLVRIDVGVMINNAPPKVVQTSSVSTSSAAGYLAGSEVQLGPARPAPDIVKLSNIIRAVAGLDMQGRGDTLEVIPVHLWQPDALPEQAEELVEKPWYMTLPLWAYGAAAGGLVLMIIVGLIILRRRNHGKAEEEAELVAFPTRADELQAALEGAEYEPEPTLAELRSKVHELLGTKSDLGAEILSAWINEGVADDGADELEEAA